MSERQAQTRPAARPLSHEVALGIDVGSTNTKVVLLSLGGSAGTPPDPAASADAGIRNRPSEHAEIAWESFPTPEDPAALVGRTEAAIRSLLEVHPARPVVVGIASMAETGVPLDAAGEPVGSFVRWNRAGTPRPSALVRRVGADSLFVATGVPPLRKAPLLVLEALREAEPDRWSRLSRWAGAGDLITRALTGRLITDHTLAGRTLAYRLPPAGSPLPDSFDADLLGEVGLRPGQLPTVAQPGGTAGAVTAAAAGRTGLPAGTPVVVAGHDHAVGAWGAGVRMPGERADSVGTSEALLRIAGSPLDRRAALGAGMSVTRSVSGEFETLLAGSPAGGSLIGALVRGELGGTPLDPAEVFAGPGTTGPSAIALPYPLGRQCPAPDPEARLRFLDLSGGDVDPRTLDGRALAAAVLLGLCLQLRWMRDEQERITREPATGVLRMIGAAASGNAAWAYLRAGVLGEPVESGSSAEPVAAAAALLAAVRIGAAPPRAVLPRTAPVGPSATGRYDDAYAVFIAAATARPLTPA
jgi:sugar (pentulose or hexulose) kinase